MAKNTDNPSGGDFYKERNLVPLIVYVPKAMREKLKKEAKKQYRTLQQSLRMLIEKHCREIK